MAEQLVCPACGSSDSAGLFHAKDHLVSNNEFLVRRCNDCGMGWTADPPPEEEAGNYYLSEEYISHSDRKQSIADYIYHLARSFMLSRKRRLVVSAVGKKTGSLVDIGSGTGYFAAFMKKRGWQVTGIEISDNAREYSVARFAIRAVTPAEIREMPPGSADCITFWHVLEHLYDPDMWMGEVNRILRDDGRCIIALPNFASADSTWFRNRWAALDVPRHLWHFTPAAFVRFAGRHELACEKISALPLDLFYISCLSYRNEGKSIPLIRGVATGLFIALRNLFRKEQASSLVYVVSKKKP